MSLVFEGTLTLADNRRVIPYTFDIPAGMTQFHMEFEYNPIHTDGQPYPQQISFAIHDPNGTRGEWSRPNRAGYHISAASATPGTLPGAIMPGTWTVFLLSHRIQPPIPVTYKLTITWSDTPASEEAPHYAPGIVTERGAGWYRGDLHAHTIHSDGSWDIPELVAYLRGRGLDFVTLSDHNTISGLAQHRSLAENGFVAIGGIELSTFYGHALALGVHEWFDWRVGTERELTMPELAQRVLDAGRFFVIAHPTAPGDPECCGCHWEHLDMMPGNAPAVEIWNGWWDDYNEQGVQLYYGWLNAGHRLVATSGTDIHGRPLADAQGRAASNVVYAGSFSEDGILSALKRGHSYISAGPELLLNARTDSGTAGIMGDMLPSERATVSVRWSAAPQDARLRLIVNGVVQEARAVETAGEASWTLDAGTARWCTAELRDADGSMWAIT
ncbi:MAG: CehA/McbA family metallohydrolase, partial [Chloroflexota bacterium]|nr:CehA/McbA family metallohydrolase [Chloroflexota bacterium]